MKDGMVATVEFIEKLRKESMKNDQKPFFLIFATFALKI